MRGTHLRLAAILLVLGFCGAHFAAAQTFTATHYGFQWRIEPEKERLGGRVRISFVNSGNQPSSRLEFILYRLLKVASVQDGQGKPLRFTQQVVSMTDEETWQVNHVVVELPTPVPPGGESAIGVEYGGGVFGYPEVMRYVRERIGEDYVLLRGESFPYPLLGDASVATFHRFFRPLTFDATINVPTGFVLVCGDAQALGKASEGRVEFACSRTRPLEQLNFALAKFQVLRDDPEHIAVYALPSEAQAAQTLLTEMKRARDFYSTQFGKLEDSLGVNLIELPDGWGSYTGKGFIFQTAAAFKDPSSIPELYHEVAHAWNAVPKPEVQRARWFDEAFASYFEYLAVESFQGDEAYRKGLERGRQSFVRAAARDAQAVNVPIADYGKYEIGQYSYTKGEWSLYVLDQLLGRDVFRRAITRFLTEYRTKPADFMDFKNTVENVCSCNLKSYFDDWIFGAASSRLLIDNVPVEQIVARYRTARH